MTGQQKGVTRTPLNKAFTFQNVTQMQEQKARLDPMFVEKGIVPVDICTIPEGISPEQ